MGYSLNQDAIDHHDDLTFLVENPNLNLHLPLSHEKTPLTFHYTGCLMTGSLFYGLWNNPHTTWVV